MWLAVKLVADAECMDLTAVAVDGSSRGPLDSVLKSDLPVAINWGTTDFEYRLLLERSTFTVSS